jgi:prefoldin subunit 4
MSMLAAEDENDTDVRPEDQENINRFARLNARLHGLRGEREAFKVGPSLNERISRIDVYASYLVSHNKLLLPIPQKELESLDDASTDLMMASEDKVMLMLGEAFLEVSEGDATEYCEQQVDVLQEKVDKLQSEEDEIAAEQAKLKVILYGRFGKSINLEEK